VQIACRNVSVHLFSVTWRSATTSVGKALQRQNVPEFFTNVKRASSLLYDHWAETNLCSTRLNIIGENSFVTSPIQSSGNAISACLCLIILCFFLTVMTIAAPVSSKSKPSHPCQELQVGLLSFVVSVIRNICNSVRLFTWEGLLVLKLFIYNIWQFFVFLAILRWKALEGGILRCQVQTTLSMSAMETILSISSSFSTVPIRWLFI